MESVFPFFLLLWILFALLGLAAAVFWIFMLIDCVTKEPSEGNDKLIWVLIILFANWIGALVYLLVRRPERIRQTGQ